MKKNLILLSLLLTVAITGCSTKGKPNIKDINKFAINIDEDTKEISQENGFSISGKDTKNNQTHKDNNTSSINNTPPFVSYDFPRATSKKDAGKKLDKKTFKINVENISIGKFSKLVFGQILNSNYTLDSDVESSNKNVTLQIQKPVSLKELYSIAERILENNGFYIENINDYHHIKKGKNTSTRNTYGTNFYFGRNIDFSNLSNDEEITVFVPYYYTDLTKMSNLFFRYYLSHSTALIEYIKTDNIMIVKDKVKNIKELLMFIDTIDTSAMKDKLTKLIYLNYLDSRSFKDRLNKLLPSLGIPIAQGLHQTGLLLEEIPEINAILLISDKSQWIENVQYWQKKLDTLDLNDDEKRVYIYKPKNRKAEELKVLIEDLFNRTGTTMAPNQSKSSMGEKDKKNTKASKDNKTLLNPDERVRVIEDSTRNALILYSTASEYKTIYEMLKKLDVLAKQVLIQVTIAELTLKDSLQYGLEWYLKNDGNRYTSSIGTAGLLGIGGSGLVSTVTKVNDKFSAILNAFAQKDLINILSAPKLVVLDNQIASINVGTEVPILSSTSSLESTATDIRQTQNFQYRRTGITLDVTPTIHSEGSLTLQISQSTSEAQQNNVSSISSPIILNRSIKTNVVLKSNQSLLLGGLIKENKSDTDIKVPLLGDIPLIGNFFKTSSLSTDKTELMIIVKPIILNNSKSSEAITKNMQKLLSITN